MDTVTENSRHPVAGAWGVALTLAVTLVLVPGNRAAGAAAAGEAARARQVPRAVLVHSWGCLDCSGPELFSAIQDVSVNTAGLVAVLDREAPFVRRFSTTRTFPGLGLEGQGPGEMILPMWVYTSDDGRLQVVDMRRLRVLAFAPGGELSASHAFTVNPSAAAYDAAHTAWLFVSIDWAARPMATRILRNVVEATDPVGLDLTEFPLRPDGQPATYYPFAVRPDGGIAIGDGHGEYRIRVFAADGTVERDLTRDVARVPRSDTEMEIEIARRNDAANRMRARTAGGPEAGAGRDGIVVEPRKRHFLINALEYDDRGRLWVLSERGDWQQSVFDVFDAQGAWLGEVSLDCEVQHYSVRGTFLATACLGADDLPETRLWELRS